MSIDMARLEYQVLASLASGGTLDLTNAVLSCSWGEQNGELAQKAAITFANAQTDSGYISEVLELCTYISISGNGEEVFLGQVWEWEYSSAIEKEVTVIAYDALIYATQSNDNSYYTSGKSTKSIVEDICGRWGISVDYTYGSHIHEKTKYANKRVADQIIETLNVAQRKLGEKYTAIMVGNTFLVRPRGSNQQVPVFNASNTIQVSNSLSMNSLITKVVIVGKEDKEGRSSVEATVLGRTEFGTLQAIVQRDNNTTLADATAEAGNLLKEKGSPVERIELRCPDVPQTRKGDKIKLEAGNLSGEFYVLSVTHNASEKIMDVELER